MHESLGLVKWDYTGKNGKFQKFNTIFNTRSLKLPNVPPTQNMIYVGSWTTEILFQEQFYYFIVFVRLMIYLQLPAVTYIFRFPLGGAICEANTTKTLATDRTKRRARYISSDL